MLSTENQKLHCPLLASRPHCWWTPWATCKPAKLWQPRCATGKENCRKGCQLYLLFKVLESAIKYGSANKAKASLLKSRQHLNKSLAFSIQTCNCVGVVRMYTDTSWHTQGEERKQFISREKASRHCWALGQVKMRLCRGPYHKRDSNGLQRQLWLQKRKQK